MSIERPSTERSIAGKVADSLSYPVHPTNYHPPHGSSLGALEYFYDHRGVVVSVTTDVDTRPDVRKPLLGKTALIINEDADAVVVAQIDRNGVAIPDARSKIVRINGAVVNARAIGNVHVIVDLVTARVVEESGGKVTQLRNGTGQQ